MLVGVVRLRNRVFFTVNYQNEEAGFFLPPEKSSRKTCSAQKNPALEQFYQNNFFFRFSQNF